jgi:hypothetical protein
VEESSFLKMSLDSIISDIVGWFILQAYLHPKEMFIASLIAFALYCWTIDYIGYVLFRRKCVSEYADGVVDEKGGTLRPKVQSVSQSLYGGHRAHLNFILNKHNIQQEPTLLDDLEDWKLK